MARATKTKATFFQKGFSLTAIGIICLSFGISAASSFGVNVEDIDFWHQIAITATISLFSYWLGGNMRS